MNQHVDDIEASKAPLLEHLIELRSRLIKAVIAFLVAFVVCFYFSRHIYNVLVEPYVGVVGAENAKLIATHFLEQFYTNLKLSMFGAGLIAFPVIASQIYMFVAPGLYRNERQAFLPYLIATPVFFVLGGMLVYFVVMPLLIRFSTSMQQINVPGEATIELLAQGQRISVADHDADLRLRHRVPAAGDPDPARPGRDHRFRLPAQQAALCDRRGRGGGRDPDAARRDLDVQPCAAHAASLRRRRPCRERDGEEPRPQGRCGFVHLTPAARHVPWRVHG